MRRNNKRNNLYATQLDYISKAKKQKELVKQYEPDKKGRIKKSVSFAALEYLHTGEDYILESNIKAINNGKNKYQPNIAKGDYSPVTEAVKRLYEQNFFDIVTGKTQTGNELQLQVIDLNNKLHHSNQKSKGNESLFTAQEAYSNFKDFRDNKKGYLFTYDLETIGGDNTNGIWNPFGITEFSMHEYSFETKKNEQVDVFIGRSKKEMDKLVSRIERAIEDGSIATNEELRVTAGRLSLYGNEKTKIAKLNNNDYYTVTNFVDTKYSDHKNIDLIKAGAERFVEAYDNTGYINVGDDKIKSDIYKVHQTVSKAMQLEKNNLAIMADQNGTVFDTPILNRYLNETVKSHPSLANMHLDNRAVFSPKSKNHLDLLGVSQLFTSYNSYKELYPGIKEEDFNNMTGLRKQENLLKHLYPNEFENLTPHLASDDVIGLGYLYNTPSDKLGGKSAYEYMMEKISSVEEHTKAMQVKNQLFIAKNQGKAKKGKGHLNFAMSKTTNDIFTHDNHILGMSDNVAAVKGAVKESFSTGAGINKGGLYTINKIGKVEAGDKFAQQMAELYPEFATQDLFMVGLELQVDKKFKNTRLNDLIQYKFFKTEKELQAYMSDTFNMVAELDQEGSWKLVNNEARKQLDLRQVSTKNNNVVIEDINNNHKKTDAQIIDDFIYNQNKKLSTSRADNNINRDNSQRKMEKALNLKQEIESIIKEGTGQDVKIKGYDINNLMSQKVITSKGKPIIGINEAINDKLTKVVKNTLSYESGGIERILDSSIDNFSAAMDLIDSQEDFLTNLLGYLNNNDTYKKSNGVNKQAMFERSYRRVREEYARSIYEGNDSTIRKQVLGDKTLISSFAEFQNKFEIDISGMMKSTNTNKIDLIHPSEANNILGIDLANNNSFYGMLDNLVKAKHGKVKYHHNSTEKMTYQKDAFKDFLVLLKNDDVFKKNKEFNLLLKDLDYKKRSGVIKKDFNLEDTSTRLINIMKDIKSKDAGVGIINTDPMMRSLQGNPAFNKGLNKASHDKEFMHNIISDVVENTKVSVLDNVKDASKFVEQNLLKHYLPDIDPKTLSKEQNILMTSLKKDMKEYLSGIVHTAGKLGAEVIPQANGSLVLSRGTGTEPVILDNLTKIKYDKETNVIYSATGNMKNQVYNKLDIDMGKNGGVKTGLSTNVGSVLNKYDFDKIIGYKIKDGKISLDEGLEELASLAKGRVREATKGATINNFGGNDMDSNFLIDFSDIKNISKDLFRKDGKLNHLIKDKDFIDKTMLSRMEEYVTRFGDKTIENLGPGEIRLLTKNVQHILQTITKKNGLENDFSYLVDNLNFSGQEKKVSSNIGMSRTRAHNSTLSVHDNVQRPTVTQAANAYMLSKDNIRDLGEEYKHVIPANILSTAMMDKKTTRNILGFGETTTDVMMRINYVDTSALNVMLDMNFKDVIEKAKVEYNVFNADEKVITSTVESLKRRANVFEQERVMNSELFEKISGGTKSAQTQFISNGTDIVNALQTMNTKQSQKQADFILKHRGVFDISDNGTLTFNSSAGSFVERGKGLFKYEGFAGLESEFASKIHRGIFNHGYYDKYGNKMTDDAINNIISQNKNIFKGITDKYDLTKTLDDLLNANEIVGKYFVEDIAAYGYIKNMTSGVEKGMTNLLYSSTGSINKNIKGFFKDAGLQEVVNGVALTEQALNPILNSSKADINKLLSDYGFNNVSGLKSALSEERNILSKIMFKDIFKGSDILANDAVVKHNNVGQMYQGLFGEAIRRYSDRKGETMETAYKKVSELLEKSENQFIEKWDLTGTKIESKGMRLVTKPGKESLYFADHEGNLEELGVTFENMSNFNKEKFNNLLKNMDVGLVSNDLHFIDKDGEIKAAGEMIGSFNTITDNQGRKIIQGSKTYEPIKILRDAETQTGVPQEFLDMKTRLRKLETQRIRTDNKHEKNMLDLEILKLKNNIQAYEGTVKQMKVGDQELAILERISITDAHADKMASLIEKGELSGDITDQLLASNALKDKIVRRADGQIALSNDVRNKQALEHLVGSFKKQLWYDPLNEKELTNEMLKSDKYSKLTEVYEYVTSRGNKIGVDTAEKMHNAKMARHADDFNQLNKHDIDSMINKGFNVVDINNLALNVDEIVDQHLLVDLGEKYGAEGDYSRYVAIPGLGKNVGDEEIRTKAHNDLISLKYRHSEASSSGEYDDIERVKDLLLKTKDDVSGLVYGKNAYAHSLSKIDVNAASYRLKSSSIIGDYSQDSIKDFAKELGVDIIGSDADILRKAQINGKSISDWEQNGIHYDYKFVSTQQMEKMGYFEDSTLKQFGMSSREDMIEHLKTNGTMDITGRYPFIMNKSQLATHVFLDETLDGSPNRTRVSGVTLLKPNADNDGDSFSSFRIQFDHNGSAVDYSLYKAKGYSAVDEGLMTKSMYKEFERLETYTTLEAMTHNKEIQKEVNSALIKDRLKNMKTGNADMLSSLADVEGNSIFTRNSMARNITMPNLDEHTKIEENVNSMLEHARGFLSESDSRLETLQGDINVGDSVKKMHVALDILEQNKVDPNLISQYELNSVKRFHIDRYSAEMMGKTGLAATGNVNVAVNSIKLAMASTEGATTNTNFVWDMLYKAEQDIISSKKADETRDDVRIEELSQSIRNMFSGDDVKRAQGKQEMSAWLDKNGKGAFEYVGERYGDLLLTPAEHKAIQEGTVNYQEALQPKFLNLMEEKAADKRFLSHKAAYDSVGRGGTYNGSKAIKAGIAASEPGVSFKGDVLGYMGFADQDEYLNYRSKQRVLEEVAEQQSVRQAAYNNSGLSEGLAKQAGSGLLENVSKGIGQTIGSGVSSGIGMAVLGMAGGMLASGYAMGNPLNDKSAEQVSQEMTQPVQTMSIPQFMEQEGGFATGNSQQGYIINLKADTKKGRKHIERIMGQAAQATVGGAVSINMNLKNSKDGITDRDIENYLNRHF